MFHMKLVCFRLVIPAAILRATLAGSTIFNEKWDSVDWTRSRAVNESLQACRWVHEAFNSGSTPPNGGLIPRVALPTSKSRIFFYHVPKSGGSSFSALLPRLLGSVITPVVVSSPELEYPESATATKKLRKTMGKGIRMLRMKDIKSANAAMKWPGRANIVSREFNHLPGKDRAKWLQGGKPLLLLHVLYTSLKTLEQKRVISDIVFIRRPDERIASQFHHDAIRSRTGCLNNSEEVVKHCVYMNKSLSHPVTSCAKCFRRVELKYSETATKLIMPAHTLADVKMIGITEQYELSVCLFLFTFHLRRLFDAQCLETGLQAPMAFVVNSAQQQSAIGVKRMEAEGNYKTKALPRLCGPLCKQVNIADYKLWKTAVILFWWRVHYMARDSGVRFKCRSS